MWTEVIKVVGNIVIAALLPGIIVLFMFYGKYLVNKKVFVKKIVWNAESPLRKGILSISNDKIESRFLWTKKAYFLSDIELIAGFGTDDYVNDTDEDFIVLGFKEGNQIVINIDLDDRFSTFVNRLVLDLTANPLDFSEIRLGEIDKLKIFYKKTTVSL